MTQTWQTSVRRALGAAAVLATLVGCTQSVEPEPEPEPLTVSEAGERYLRAVCPVNDRWDAVDLEVDRLRLTVLRGEPDTRRVAAALADMAEASREAAELLTDDSVGWPDAATQPISSVGRTLVADAAEAEEAAVLDGVDMAEYRWQGADAAAAAASAARDALGLPDDADVACAALESPPEDTVEDTVADTAEDTATE